AGAFVVGTHLGGGDLDEAWHGGLLGGMPGRRAPATHTLAAPDGQARAEPPMDHPVAAGSTMSSSDTAHDQPDHTRRANPAPRLGARPPAPVRPTRRGAGHRRRPRAPA